jgi:hypothetical protein
MEGQDTGRLKPDPHAGGWLHDATDQMRSEDVRFSVAIAAYQTGASYKFSFNRDVS